MNPLPTAAKSRAFTLIELFICIAIIALLIGILLPALSGARDAARLTKCLSNQRQLSIAWTGYANDYKDLAMPLAYWTITDIAAANATFGTPGSTESIFWWGSHGTSTTPVDYARGFAAQYLDAALAPGSVLECPCQPWGTYDPQGPSRTISSTYGYNGYYLSPAKTPGWGGSIGFRPWRRLFEVPLPSELFIFADAMLDMQPVTNCALLDPPQLFSSHSWHQNSSPTTSFRHGKKDGTAGSTAAVAADASARTYRAQPECLTSPDVAIGSVGLVNGPHYVPDWQEWR